MYSPGVENGENSLVLYSQFTKFSEEFGKQPSQLSRKFRELLVQNQRVLAVLHAARCLQKYYAFVLYSIRKISENCTVLYV